jgi:hypothetical protein
MNFTITCVGNPEAVRNPTFGRVFTLLTLTFSGRRPPHVQARSDRYTAHHTFE